MKKSLLLLSIPLLTVAILSHCGGGGGGGAKTPSADTFNNPDGSVTSDNATQVVNDALKSSTTQDAVGGLLFSPKVSAHSITKAFRLVSKTRLQSSTDFQACIDTSSDGKQFTLDWDCLSDTGLFAEESCTFSGKTKMTIEGEVASPTGYTYEYIDWGVDCGASETISNVNGEVKSTGDLASEDPTIITCVNLTYTVNGTTDTVNQCYLEGKVAVDDGSGDTVVCVSIEPNAECTSVSSEWEDVDGTATISCDITKPTDLTAGCVISDVEAVDNCTVTRS